MSVLKATRAYTYYLCLIGAEDERNKCRPEGDDFSEDEKRLLPPAASMFDDIGEMPMSDIHWPFRVSAFFVQTTRPCT
jgi:hypothetical protein